MSFSERFSKLVAEHAWNQAEIAAALELSEGSVVNYKRGRVPKAEELHRIARFFGVSMEWLLTGDDRHSPSPLVMREEPAPYGAGRKEKDRVRKRLDEVIRELEELRREISEQRN